MYIFFSFSLKRVQVRTFKGHANEKNFVGLTVSSEYIACGSETNEVFVYHKVCGVKLCPFSCVFIFLPNWGFNGALQEISKPLTWHRFGSPDMDDTEDEAGSYFISAVCWKSDRPTILTANSQGTIKVLVLAAWSWKECGIGIIFSRVPWLYHLLIVHNIQSVYGRL